MAEQGFVPFWYDSNLAWGDIKTIEDWRKIVRKHMEYSQSRTSAWLLGRSKSTESTKKELAANNGRPKADDLPSFGLRAEHFSDLTLEAWAKQVGMYELLVNIE